MSKSQATKRRKVWVNFYGGEYGKSDTFRAVVYMQHGRAIAHGNGAETAAFLERLPGDVVLSREEVDAKATAIARELVDAGYDEEDAPMIVEAITTAMLRGRR